MPESMRLFVERVHRDDARIAELEKAVREFLAELDAKIGTLNRLFSPAREPVNMLAGG
jgi:tetrahydromethanopterin S-methyltransferase subunit B